eukprot:CAMPEP_0113846174 /NCGR_PEP_ID=MMETSP0372-20130328/1163_1 /TAXON_ID=340204 /ORGANISM="Lankesteria abbotti" /LENGTH=485 /DNA_ID=CAMNT_0000815293 /DNA_START=163 /DNA_END=1620 /DNA_ORIENTATION=+ /assembly_acc=CAM_ASM_000359
MTDCSLRPVMQSETEFWMSRLTELRVQCPEAVAACNGLKLRLRSAHTSKKVWSDAIFDPESMGVTLLTNSAAFPWTKCLSHGGTVLELSAVSTVKSIAKTGIAITTDTDPFCPIEIGLKTSEEQRSLRELLRLAKDFNIATNFAVEDSHHQLAAKDVEESLEFLNTYCSEASTAMRNTRMKIKCMADPDLNLFPARVTALPFRIAVDIPKHSNARAFLLQDSFALSDAESVWQLTDTSAEVIFRQRRAARIIVQFSQKELTEQFVALCVALRDFGRMQLGATLHDPIGLGGELSNMDFKMLADAQPMSAVLSSRCAVKSLSVMAAGVDCDLFADKTTLKRNDGMKAVTTGMQFSAKELRSLHSTFGSRKWESLEATHLDTVVSVKLSPTSVMVFKEKGQKERVMQLGLLTYWTVNVPEHVQKNADASLKGDAACVAYHFKGDKSVSVLAFPGKRKQEAFVDVLRNAWQYNSQSTEAKRREAVFRK